MKLTPTLKSNVLAVSSRALLAALVMLATAPVLAAPVVGTSAAVRGNVFVSTSGAQRKAQVRDAIKLQDRVATKDDSALQILLLDRSTFTVGQNCQMTIDRFVYDPDTSIGKISAKVTKGAFRFMSGRIGKKNPTSATVSTPSATIGIRGTFFEGVVGEDALALAQLGGVGIGSATPRTASLVLLRGPGRSRNTLDRTGVITVGNSGGSVTLTKGGFAAFVPGPGQRPVGPFRITPDMLDYLDFFLRSAPNGPPVTPIDIPDAGSDAAGQDKFEEPTETNDGISVGIEDGITDPLRPPGGCLSTCLP